jgi:hypothetical protein
VKENEIEKLIQKSVPTDNHETVELEDSPKSNQKNSNFLLIASNIPAADQIMFCNAICDVLRSPA